MKFRTYTEAYGDICGKESEQDVEPDRLRAAHTVAERCAAFRGWGWKIGVWRPTTLGSPCVIGTGYGRRWEEHGGWLDHPYTLTLPTETPGEKAERIFVAEPYDVGPAAMRHLSGLQERGWNATIIPWYAIHFPGHTTAIWLRRHPWQW